MDPFFKADKDMGFRAVFCYFGWGFVPNVKARSAEQARQVQRPDIVCCIIIEERVQQPSKLD